MSKTQIRGNKQVKDLSIRNEQIADDAAIQTHKLAEGAELLKRDGSVALTGNLDANQNRITNVAEPVNNQDAVRKVDLDGVASKAASDLAAEEAARIASDSNLQNQLDIANVEIEALVNDLSAEEAARVAGDADLQSQIDALEAASSSDLAALEARVTTAEGDINSLESGLAAEIARATSAEEQLALDLSQEAADRASADTALQSNIDAEEARALAAESVLQGNIDAEEAARIAGDSATLASAQSYTDQKVSDLVNGAPQLLDTLNELAAAIGNDENFVTTVTNLVADANAAVDAEEAARIAADSTLQSNIDAEEAARIAADANLQAQLDEATAGVFVSREVPSGSIDGSNKVFALANVPNAGSEQVYLNGVLQNVGVDNDYTIVDETITFSIAPEIGSVVLVNYISNAIVVVTGDGSGAGGATNLNALTDVMLSSPASNQVLKYDGTKWVNATVPSGDTSAIEADIVALDGRVDVLEAVTPFSGSYNDLTNKPSLFSGSYNDLTNKPTIPSLTQVESDISALQGADVVLDSRVDALEAADVALDARLDTAEATLISLDSRVDSLEAGGVGGGGGSGSYIAPYSTEFNHTGSDAGSTYTITHNLNAQNIDVKVYLVDESTGLETISQDYFSYYNQSYGCSVLDKTSNAFTLRMFRWYPAPNSAGTYKARVVVSVVGAPASSGDIEVFQDEQFNWSGSLERTITHNKGRQPDLVQVFVQRADLGSTLWVQHYDLNGSYGWDSIAPANNNNATIVRLFTNNNGTTFPTRIRLYWFGSNDVGTASAGAFSVGGSSNTFTSNVITVPWNGNNAAVNLEQTITHNLGKKPTNIQVYVDEEPVGAPYSGYAVGRIIPMATTFWSPPNNVIYGFSADHIDNNTIKIKFYYLGDQAELKVRVACS